MADDDVGLILEEGREAMTKSIQSFRRDLQRIRTGRATTALLDGVTVDYFGAARVGDEKRFSLAEIYGDMGGLLRALIEQAQAGGEISRAVDAVAMSELLLSVFDGVVLHGILARRGCGRSELRDAALRMLAEGLLAKRGLEAGAGESKETTFRKSSITSNV